LPKFPKLLNIHIMNGNSITCFGELIVDMISTNAGTLVESEGFLKKFGGAPGNTAAGIAKLDLPVNIIAKVGNDPFGHYLKKTLDDVGVNTSHVIVSEKETTTLAFVALDKQGSRDFFFLRGAHEAVGSSEVDLPEGTTVFHFGSLTQTTERNRRATDKLLSQAKKMDAIISYDPNLRESLWSDLEETKKIMLDTAKKVDILKISQEEAYFLVGRGRVQDLAQEIFTKNLDILFITLGPQGVYYKTEKYSGFVPTITVKVIDTTGAGDAFNAGQLSALFETGKRPSQLSKEELEALIRRANIIASLSTTKKGAISAFPEKSEIQKYIS